MMALAREVMCRGAQRARWPEMASGARIRWRWCAPTPGIFAPPVNFNVRVAVAQEAMCRGAQRARCPEKARRSQNKVAVVCAHARHICTAGQCQHGSLHACLRTYTALRIKARLGSLPAMKQSSWGSSQRESFM